MVIRKVHWSEINCTSVSKKHSLKRLKLSWEIMTELCQLIAADLEAPSDIQCFACGCSVDSNHTFPCCRVVAGAGGDIAGSRQCTASTRMGDVTNALPRKPGRIIHFTEVLGDSWPTTKSSTAKIITANVGNQEGKNKERKWMYNRLADSCRSGWHSSCELHPRIMMLLIYQVFRDCYSEPLRVGGMCRSLIFVPPSQSACSLPGDWINSDSGSSVSYFRSWWGAFRQGHG